MKDFIHHIKRSFALSCIMAIFKSDAHEIVSKEGRKKLNLKDFDIKVLTTEDLEKKRITSYKYTEL